MNDRKLAEIGIGTFFYAAMMFTEGIGLMWQKKWAEYLTVIADRFVHSARNLRADQTLHHHQNRGDYH